MVTHWVVFCALCCVTIGFVESFTHNRRATHNTGVMPYDKRTDDSPPFVARRGLPGSVLGRDTWRRYEKVHARTEHAGKVEKKLYGRDYRKDVHQRENTEPAETGVVPSEQACEGGRRITCQRGTVMSPGYPGDYYGNQSCSWQIIADPGKVIEVDFVDFSLPEAEVDCVDGDHVTLTDVGSGYGDTPPVTLCGRDQLPKFSTVGNEAHVQFVTDGEGEDRGFLFNFLVRDPILCEDTIELMGESGTVTSQNYPVTYLPHSDCRWRIVSPEGTIISLDFSEVALEHARSCEWDGVTVYDGPSRQSPSLGVFCGHRQPQNIRSSDHVLLVVLMSDGSGEDRGFSLEWQAVPRQ